MEAACGRALGRGAAGALRRISADLVRGVFVVRWRIEGCRKRAVGVHGGGRRLAGAAIRIPGAVVDVDGVTRSLEIRPGYRHLPAWIHRVGHGDASRRWRWR